MSTFFVFRRYIGFVVNQYVEAIQGNDIEFLIQEDETGADLDLPCAFGMTPLMHAVVHDRPKIVALLVEQVGMGALYLVLINLPVYRHNSNLLEACLAFTQLTTILTLRLPFQCWH